MILSIVIPTYNRINFLGRMVNSVLTQIADHDLKNEVEIVISDNCSTDGTDEYVRKLKDQWQGVQIVYNRNETNIGVVKNILRLMELVSGAFSMFYGDDDLMCPGSLPQIVQTIKTNSTLAVFVFRQKNFKEISATEQLSIHECASRYFNYMGNACSAWHTGFARKNIVAYHSDIVSTCWPQTHVMYLGMYDAGLPKPVLVSHLEVYEEQPKDNNNIPNSFYLYDSMFYSLIRLGLLISEEKKDPGFYKVIGKGIFTMRRHKYASFCRYVIHTNKAYCNEKEKQDFKSTLKESIRAIKGKYKLYALPIALLNIIPSHIYLWLYLNSTSLYAYLKNKNRQGSFKNIYQQSKQRLKSLQEERFSNMQKKHAIIINKGEW